MGYMHIENLYKCPDILLFRECYALEKIHGSSAHISLSEEAIHFSSGGEKHETFLKIFNQEHLASKYQELFKGQKIILFGEVYGGKCQGMSGTYGKMMKFIVFDVKVDENWLDVPNAKDVATKFGLEFVAYEQIPATIEAITAIRDKDSEQAIRNGIGTGKMREGVVLRPLIELKKNNGDRIISKHKRNEFIETATPREVNLERLKVLEDAQAIAEEWVTPMRLEHVLDKLGNPNEMSAIPLVLKAMLEDVYREAKGEIIESTEVQKAIGKKAALLYKKKVNP